MRSVRPKSQLLLAGVITSNFNSFRFSSHLAFLNESGDNLPSGTSRSHHEFNMVSNGKSRNTINHIHHTSQVCTSRHHIPIYPSNEGGGITHGGENATPPLECRVVKLRLCSCFFTRSRFAENMRVGAASCSDPFKRSDVNSIERRRNLSVIACNSN